MEKKTELFHKFFCKNTGFSVDDVDELVEQIKSFNAGAIDGYLSKHVDKVFKEWLEKHKDKK